MGRSRWLAALLLVLILAGLFSLIVWQKLGAWRHPQWLMGLALAVWLAASILALRFWWHLPTGVLVWTGQRWELRAARQHWVGARAQVRIDLQQRMGVRMVADNGAVCWVWLESCMQPERWSALRRALYSRADTFSPHISEDSSA